MSLIGAKTAVVSLGISCQTTFQIGAAQARLSEILGEELEAVTMPFDWRIVGPADAAGMISSGEFYPKDPAELGRDRRRYWERRRCWFWHEKWDDFDRFRAKQDHLVENWGKVSQTRRQVFIASNTQNNLAQKATEMGGIVPMVHLFDLLALKSDLERQFPRPELHFVTRPSLMADLESYGLTGIRDRERNVGGVRLHMIEPDKSSWQGDPAGWAPILKRIARDGAK